MFRAVLYILLFSLKGTLLAQPVLLLERGMQGCSYGRYAGVYEDKSKKLGIREVILKTDSFVPGPDDVLNFNITKSAMWLKLKITCKENEDWRIEAAGGSLNHIDFYVVRKGIVASQQFSGIDADDKIKYLAGGRILFKSFLKPNDTVDVYVRAEAAGPMVIPLNAGSLEEFFNKDHITNLLHGAYFGIMGLMILYNLFLYFTNRGLVYIYYILYVIFSAVFNGYFLGYVLILPQSFRWIFSSVPPLSPLLFGWFGLLFTTKFLNTKELAPRYHKAIVIFMYLAFLPVIVSLSGFKHESVAIIQVFGLILVILSLSVGVRVLRSGYRPAKFYVLGFGAYMSGLLLLIVANVTKLPINGIETYALEIGSAIEIVMLSFAIGDKLNIANAEKAEAQARALQTLEENERIIREQNVLLEQKVNERTAELQEQKNLVEEKNKDILDSIRYAKRIQESLLPNEKFFERVLKGFRNQ